MQQRLDHITAEIQLTGNEYQTKQFVLPPVKKLIKNCRKITKGIFLRVICILVKQVDYNVMKDLYSNSILRKNELRDLAKSQQKSIEKLIHLVTDQQRVILMLIKQMRK